MTEHILVPINSSPLSEKALDVTPTEYPEATVTCLHVIDPTDPGYSYHPFDRLMELDEEPLHGSEAWYEKAEAFAADLFEDAERRAEDRGVDLETELVVGHPSEAIVQYARDHDVDHVIIGSHGRDEDFEGILGNVTEAVAYRSPVHVTLVR